MLWRIRAEAEVRRAPRTWFATFTFTPEVQTRAYYEALSRARSRALPLEELDEFKLRCSGTGIELTKYLKRLRKNSGVSLRYLLVPERHKSGLPHYHALIHERDYLRPLRKAVMESSYGLGHCQFRLVEKSDQVVRYICKYISKDAGARIRASRSYGSLDAPARAQCLERSVTIASPDDRLVESVEKNDPPPPSTSVDFNKMTEAEVVDYILRQFVGTDHG